MPLCKFIEAIDIATPFRQSLRTLVTANTLKLVGFLANDDVAAKRYAHWTQKDCEKTGITFELRTCDKFELEQKVEEANGDDNVHGIIIYYPVFGTKQDEYLQNVMYQNIRTIGGKNKSILPCTPLALVKVLEYINVYNPLLEYGNRLHGKVITIVNRRRPLAALLSNDGATVYSVDIFDIQKFTRKGLTLEKHAVESTTLKLEDILPLSDIVISGVPKKGFVVPTEHMKEGVIAINFASVKNFDEGIMERASILVPSVGKVTVTMLERNLLRLYSHQRGLDIDV